MGIRGKVTAAATPAKGSAKSKTAAAAVAPKKRASTATTRTAASKKTAAAKKTAASKKKATGKKTAASKKTAVGKKTTAAPKTVKKRKPAKKVKKVLTQEQKEAKKERLAEARAVDKRKTMKALALKPPCKHTTRISPFNVFISQTMATPGKSLITKDIAETYARLPDLDKARYAEIAKSTLASQKASYMAFIEAHSAEDIKNANKARRWLTRNGVRGYTELLVDHRIPKRPTGAFMSFYTTKFQSLEGNAVSEKARAAAKQWASMTDAEKKPFNELAISNLQKYGNEKAAYAKI